jgi:cytochrome P450
MSTQDPPVQSELGELIDPLSDTQLEDPYPLYRRIRREEPVVYNAKHDVWFVTRHADCLKALRDHDSFSTKTVFFPSTPWPPEVQAELDKGYSWYYLLSNNDPPDHTPLRRAVQTAFTNRQTAALERRVREIGNDLVDTFAADGQCELFNAFAYRFPALVIVEVLGLPRDDMEQLKKWGDDWVLLFSDSATTEELVEAARNYVAFQNYFKEAFEEREREPRDDLLTGILQALKNEEVRLQIEDIVNVPINLMTAGHITGTLLMTATMRFLMTHPSQLDAVKADLSLIPAAVEEALRMEPSVHGIFRTTKCPVEMGGKTIPEEARVLLVYGSANHDEDVFFDAEQYNVFRPDVAEHLGFGRGTHFCPGAPLARLEQRVAFETMLTRLPNLRLQKGVEEQRLVHFWLRGMQTIHLEWDLPALPRG